MVKRAYRLQVRRGPRRRVAPSTLARFETRRGSRVWAPPHPRPEPATDPRPFGSLSRPLPTPSQEFAAHTSAVNCLKIGRKSSGVMVTGGEDKRVNLFSIGKPQAILSLAGHQSAVECVTFDQAEEVVVAGAAGGTLKLWDLEEAKVVRTLTGHRSNCSSVDSIPLASFSPVGRSTPT